MRGFAWEGTIENGGRVYGCVLDVGVDEQRDNTKEIIEVRKEI